MADAPPAREKRRSIFNLQGSRPRLRATGASYPVLCPPHRDTFILAPLYMKVNINFSFFQKFFFARSRSKNRRRAAAPPPIQIERKCRRQGERTPQARQARQGRQGRGTPPPQKPKPPPKPKPKPKPKRSRGGVLRRRRRRRVGIAFPRAGLFSGAQALSAPRGHRRGTFSSQNQKFNLEYIFLTNPKFQP